MSGSYVTMVGRSGSAVSSQLLPSFAEGHGFTPVDECEVGTLRSLGEGGYASEGSAPRSIWIGATAVRPWGSTDPTTTDLSVLGRDVLDNFDLIISRLKSRMR